MTPTANDSALLYGERPAAPDAVGVTFTETMKGWASTTPDRDYEVSRRNGRREGNRIEFTVTIEAPDLDAMLSDPEHRADLSGTVDAPFLADGPLTVRDGRFHLLVRDPQHPLVRRMIYRMPLAAPDGTRYYLEGYKAVHDDRGFDVWSDTTTLFVDVHAGADATGPLVARGIATIGINAFRRVLSSMRPLNAPGRVEGARALARFGRFFAGSLSEIYASALSRPASPAPEAAEARVRRPLRCGEGVVHSFVTDDGVRLQLTRFEGGTKGPVMLTPGFGTSSLAYTIDTTDTNFPEYLFEHGYDVWVLDYRASPLLESASTQFTLDDIALHDYPAAVDEVRRIAGVDSVQVMAHCVGSLTFLMALAAGLEGVRSGVASQLTLHPRVVPLNRARAGLRLGNLLGSFGVDTLTTERDGDPAIADRVYDEFLRLYPAGRERCSSPVCRRILFMYGEVYDHDQLNDATHEAMHEMFGVANLGTLTHITRILNAGHAVTADGEDAYLPHADRLKLPIAFLHGANNRLFTPEGSLLTVRALSERNGADWYPRHVVPSYAHMDCFIGRNAARDVYPIVVAELDRHNPA